ncbi:MAG: hypothetical protein ACRDTN_10230 [Mycobacterium sp.]
MTTAWRAAGAVNEAALSWIATARSQAGAAAWAAGADPELYVIDIDGVLIEADSDQQPPIEYEKVAANQSEAA